MVMQATRAVHAAHMMQPGRTPLIGLLAPLLTKTGMHPACCTVRRYTIIEEIGAGTYGIVYKARGPTESPVSPEPGTSAIDDGLVALKQMRLDAPDEGVPVTTLREVALLKDLQHENIVRLREVIPQPPRLFLVFECVTPAHRRNRLLSPRRPCHGFARLLSAARLHHSSQPPVSTTLSTRRPCIRERPACTPCPHALPARPAHTMVGSHMDYNHYLPTYEAAYVRTHLLTYLATWTTT